MRGQYAVAMLFSARAMLRSTYRAYGCVAFTPNICPEIAACTGCFQQRASFTPYNGSLGAGVRCYFTQMEVWLKLAQRLWRALASPSYEMARENGKHRQVWSTARAVCGTAPF